MDCTKCFLEISKRYTPRKISEKRCFAAQSFLFHYRVDGILQTGLFLLFHIKVWRGWVNQCGNATKANALPRLKKADLLRLGKLRLRHQHHGGHLPDLLCQPGRRHRQQVVGIGVAIASLVGAVIAPTLGAVADFKGNKKKLLFAFILIGALSTAVLAFVATGSDAHRYVISHIGFSAPACFTIRSSPT